MKRALPASNMVDNCVDSAMVGIVRCSICPKMQPKAQESMALVYLQVQTVGWRGLRFIASLLVAAENHFWCPIPPLNATG